MLVYVHVNRYTDQRPPSVASYFSTGGKGLVLMCVARACVLMSV